MEAFTNVGYLALWMILLLSISRENEGSQYNRNRRSENEARGYTIEKKNGKYFVVFTNRQTNRASFDDPNWKNQQYLDLGSSRIRAAHRIDDVWKKGYTGKNITVAIVDDGIKYTHKEFEGRYLPQLSYDYVDQDSDPTPSDGHGTNCAGVIAGAANNKLCGVGVAYEANIAGIRLIDRGLPNDTDVAKAFYPFDGHKIDIFSNSWGPPDNGYVIAGPGPLSLEALRKGANEGRGGRGSIYVFSAGNGGFFGDSCAFNGFVNSIYTIPVGAVNQNGRPLYSSEACSAVMTSAYAVNLGRGFGATSGATALVSGVIALALEAKKTLTWRQVQHLIVRSSSSDVIDRSVKWTVNKAGFRVSNKVGFGFLDASRMVENAEKLTTLPRQIKCKIELKINQKIVLLRGKKNSFAIEVGRDQCRGGVINHLEHVEARFSFRYFRRGVIGAYIISPGGTESQVIFPRSLDAYVGERKYKNLSTVSVHFWGESSEGTWTVTLRNDLPSFPESNQYEARLFGFNLTLYGTAQKPPFPEIPKKNLQEGDKPRVDGKFYSV
ncbi:proprotein convertase subtilisin/kexin type 6-like [Dendronephthya gigantea]|uniref:proprotein convertase subtilisin/kexin type 6-like n=1 Tax=Dendronephthya gigantea TaxID=151771 RepID=UPI00106B3255|nr:proprotein convertase subtilisin/kexin type 6-like [Dendronephthya gigantea]